MCIFDCCIASIVVAHYHAIQVLLIDALHSCIVVTLFNARTISHPDCIRSMQWRVRGRAFNVTIVRAADMTSLNVWWTSFDTRCHHHHPIRLIIQCCSGDLLTSIWPYSCSIRQTTQSSYSNPSTPPFSAANLALSTPQPTYHYHDIWYRAQKLPPPLYDRWDWYRMNPATPPA